MMIKIVKTTLILAVMSLVATSMQAQDLLARQAPVDKKLKKVDSVELNRLIYRRTIAPTTHCPMKQKSTCVVSVCLHPVV